MRSGGDADKVLTQDYPVVRRTYPRQLPREVGSKYFTVDRLYQLIDEEETETTVWYGLRTPEDNNAKRWANSVYFGTSGTQASLKYTPTEAPPPPPSKPPKPDGICKAPVTPAPRYEYEFDLEAREIDGKTVQANETTQTNVTFYRKSYATNRNEAKADIQDDISYRTSLKSSQQTKLSQEKSTYSSLNTQYNQAVKDEDNAKAQQIVDQMEPVLQRIANLECSINSLTVEIAHYQKEYNDLVAKETALSTIGTSYTLKFGTQTVAFKTTTLTENSFSKVTIDWTLPSDGEVIADINSNRYSYSGVDEKTFDNNEIETPIYVASNESAGMCSPLGETSEVSGVVRTVNNSQSGEVTYGERIATTLSIPTNHLFRRAGYGFDYTVSSIYTNEDQTSTATGTKTVKSYFPTLSSYLPYPNRTAMTYGDITVGGYEANLQKVNAANFKLPTVYLEKFSGNVFDSMTTLHPKRNVADTLINGGTKFYIPFEYPNGNLQFDSVGLGAGVNNMTTCVTGDVTVQGTPINDENGQDDFYQRPVSPEEPFPNGVGWNMQANQSTINSMKTWYSDWTNDPFNPNASYNATYYLTGDVIAEIQKYAQANPLQKGKSMFNQISIPRKK